MSQISSPGQLELRPSYGVLLLAGLFVISLRVLTVVGGHAVGWGGIVIGMLSLHAAGWMSFSARSIKGALKGELLPGRRNLKAPPPREFRRGPRLETDPEQSGRSGTSPRCEESWDSLPEVYAGLRPPATIWHPAGVWAPSLL